jgi:GLUG motif-containing protein
MKRTILLFIFFTILLLGSSSLSAWSGGSGSTGDPWQIANITDLLQFQGLGSTNGDHFIQTADIDASSITNWSPVSPFELSSYDGGCYVIDGLQINNANDKIGFLGEVKNSTISYLGLTNVNITGKGPVGALAGHADVDSEIVGCYSTGTVNSNEGEGVGGLIGYNYSYLVELCYSEADVNATSSSSNAIGGLIGYHYSDEADITNCYSAGSVTGTNNVGGFVGTINAGPTILNCFWDTQTSGQSGSAGSATGETTANMKDYTTFTGAGWDFSFETANGTDDYWSYDPAGIINDGYMVLLTCRDDPLPVVLSSFTALYINGTPVLNWITQSETNNAYWNVYRTPSENFGQAVHLNQGYLIEGQGSTSEPTYYSFTDESPVITENTYWYWIENVEYSGANYIHGPISLTIPLDDEHEETPPLPELYGLSQSYPNPFNPYTTIKYILTEDSLYDLTIYNMKGQKIRQLANTSGVADTPYYRTWDGKDDKGNDVTSGIYFYKLTTSYEVYTQKMILLK